MVCFFFVSGCATIINGSKNPIAINSNPDGAEISIINKKGEVIHKGTTPATVTLKSGAGYFKGEDYKVIFKKMVKANLLIPEGFENNLLSWMINFQAINEEYEKRYENSREIASDGDIFVFADPEWSHPDYPLGLAVFSPEQNCAAILGMRYFGEIKKGTLTLAWGIAARNGYAACHGGLKRYRTKEGGRSFVLAVFGLSGSGKSTITHAKHRDKYEITVLHDDALAVNVDGKYAIAMEPAYFDKVQDYPIGCEANKFLVTLQNCGVTIDADGKRIVVPEDIRNGNGRAIKSRFWSPDRVDRIDEPLSAICWLMKDPTLPPILRLTDPSLAATMGATLATKRTSAERLAPGVDPNLLVIESYANPFRTYPLSMDYKRFKKLIEDGVELRHEAELIVPGSF